MNNKVIIKYWAKQNTTKISEEKVDEKDVAKKCREIISNGGSIYKMKVLDSKIEELEKAYETIRKHHHDSDLVLLVFDGDVLLEVKEHPDDSDIVSP